MESQLYNQLEERLKKYLTQELKNYLEEKFHNLSFPRALEAAHCRE